MNFMQKDGCNLSTKCKASSKVVKKGEGKRHGTYLNIKRQSLTPYGTFLVEGNQTTPNKNETAIHFPDVLAVLLCRGSTHLYRHQRGAILSHLRPAHSSYERQQQLQWHGELQLDRSRQL